MKPAVVVNEIKSRPPKTNTYSMIMCGIRTKESAEKWGAKYGFSLVYWIRADEKVYGVKSIADDARSLEKQSAEMVGQMEMHL